MFVEYYRAYTADGAKVKGKYAVMFEEEYRKAAAMTKYHTLFQEVDLDSDATEVHDGYSPSTRRGIGRIPTTTTRATAKTPSAPTTSS